MADSTELKEVRTTTEEVSIDPTPAPHSGGDMDNLLRKVHSHLEKGAWKSAETLCRRILEKQPDNIEARIKLGIALYFQKNHLESAETLKELGNKLDNNPEGLHWLLAACREGHDLEGTYEAATKLRSQIVEEIDELWVYQAFEDCCAWREADAVRARALELAQKGHFPSEQLVYLMVLLNHIPNVTPAVVYDIYRIWGDTVIQSSKGVRLAEETPPPVPESRLKIAYLSADFREHPIGKFMRTIFASHDHRRFEIYSYVHQLTHDVISEEIRLASDHFIDISDLDDEKLARRIHEDGIHILVEIGSHMAHSRLSALAWKPAPVQITYLAEPNTTGLSTVDFRITDPYSEAPGGTRYIEQLLYMPESFLCMGDLPDFERISTTPAEKSGHITFASFNGVRKFNPEVIAVWSKILRRVKKSRLVIKSPGANIPVTRNNIVEEFQRHGIREERLEFVEYCTAQEHADWHNKVDIALDCFPYNGTTTTFDTLWMGVPVITLVGNRHVQRTSYSILKNIGFDTAAAAFTVEEYVDKAVHLAENPATLSFLRRCLPDMIRHSILFQPERFTAQLENLYVSAWEKKMGPWQRRISADPEPVSAISDSHAKQPDEQVEISHIFIAGMPRTAMAWVARAVSKLTRDNIKIDASPPSIHFLHAPTGEALKTLQESDARLIYIRRDLRDALTALMDIHGDSMETLLERGMLTSLENDDLTWNSIPDMLAIRHELIAYTPREVIKDIAAHLGHTIDDEEAENIAASCQTHRKKLHAEQHQEEVEAFGLPDKSLAQADQEATISEGTDIDPPGMHKTHLSDIQAIRLRHAAWQWLLEYQYEQQPYPGVNATETALLLNMQDDIKICLPASIEMPSTYKLLEQEDWQEPEIAFLRQWIHPGMQCIDIGAGYGCYTTTLCKRVGPEGRVWAFEPGDLPADFLQHSLDLNGINHCTLHRKGLSDKRENLALVIDADAELNTVTTTAPPGKHVSFISARVLDEFHEKQQWHDIDFVRLNMSGHECQMLEGGEEFFTRNSPLVMVAHATDSRQGNTDIIHKLGKYGYTPYQLIPGIDALVPFDIDGMQANTLFNLFFCKKDRAEKLRKQGYLIHTAKQAKQAKAPKEELWPEIMKSLPYAQTLLPIWLEQTNQGDQQPGWELYREALNLYAQARHADTASKRLAGLQIAFVHLSELLDIHVNIPRLLTLTRVSLDLGINAGARQLLDEIIRYFDRETTFVPEEPFIAVSKWAEAIDPQDRLADWAMAQAIQSRYSLDSSYWTGGEALPALQLFRELGFGDAGMERRLQLTRMRIGLQGRPEPSPLLKQASEENLNPGFWNGNPELVPNPNWVICQARRELPYICSFPKSGNTMARIVIEHYFQRPTLTVYASDPSILFEGRREHAVAVKAHYMEDVPQNDNKLVYIHRDPRDALISLFKWKHATPCTESPEEFEAFIRIEGKEYAHELKEALSYTGPKLIIAYSDLVEKPQETFSKIISFLDDAPIDNERLESAIKMASKEAVADFLGAIIPNRQQLMPTEKKTSRWRELLTPAQIALIRAIVGTTLLEKLGYPLENTGTPLAREAEPAAQEQTSRTEHPHKTKVPTQYGEGITADDIFHQYKELNEDALALNLNREQRAEEAQRWLTISPETIASPKQSELDRHENILTNGLRHHAWTETEEAFVDQLRSYADDAIQQGNVTEYVKSAMAAMLYCYPHQFPLATNMEVFPPWFIERFLEFITSRILLLHESGDTARSCQAISDWVEIAAQHVLSTNGNPPWNFVARELALKLMTTPLYMVDGNQRRFFQTRARLLEFSFGDLAGWEIDHTMQPRPKERKKIRIGFIAKNFGASTETYGTLSIYENMDRDLFDIRLFPLQRLDTDTERYCIQCADSFTPLNRKTHQENVALLRDQDLDMVVFATNVTGACNDITLISMHRIARVQIHYASVTTTGFRHSDYFVSGTLSEPENAQEQYTERLEMFDGPLQSYSLEGQPIVPEIPSLQRKELDIPDDAVVYISGANFNKILPEVEHAWLQILDLVPGSVLLLYPLNPYWAPDYPLLAFWNRLKKRCAQYDIDDSRIRIIRMQEDRDNIYAILKCADIYLDSFPFSGGTSLVDPLRISLPPVTMTGHALRSLLAQSTLYDMGLHDLVTENVGAYIDLAVSMGNDPELRMRYANKVTEAMQSDPCLLNTKLYGAKVGEVYKRIARRHGLFPMAEPRQCLGE